jgi:AcrR family transcriptional regulator
MEIGAAQTRKAGRPLSFDRQAALRQAMMAFWAHGYESTSIADLTAAMGVTAPSLYAAFGDKKRLFLEAMRLYAGAPEDLQAELDAAPTARAAAQAMLRNAAVAFTGVDTPRGCLLASATASVSVAAADMQQAVSDIRSDIRQRLAARFAKDVGATPAAEAQAAMVVGLIQGMSVLARDGVGREGLLAMVDCAMASWPEAGAGRK